MPDLVDARGVPIAPGDTASGRYALLHANGMPWAELVALIQEEAVRDPARCYPCDELRTTKGCWCDSR